MGKLESAEKICIRSKKTNKILAVYPDKITGTDEEITKKVKDWYYASGCEAEDELLTAYVDVMTSEEIQSREL